MGRRAIVGAGFLAAIAAAMFFVFSAERGSVASRERLMKAVASAPHRVVMLRLSGFPHSASPGSSRSAATPSDDLRLKSVALAILADTRPNDNEHQFTRSAAALISGDTHMAANALAAQTAREPTNARAWNDYAVALYEIAGKEDGPRTLAEALAAADRAAALDPAMREACFNRAAILEALQLRTPANAAWQRYLLSDSSSAWADEARTALRRTAAVTEAQHWDEEIGSLESAVTSGDRPTVERIIRAFPQQARTRAEGEYLSRWAQQMTGGERSVGEKSLQIARVIGERLAALESETLLRDAVATIDAARASGAADTLMRAHVAYKAGRLLIHARKPSEAEPILREAESQFAAAKSPMALVTRYYRAGIAFDLRNQATARALLADVERQLQPGFRALHAEVLWEQSRISGRVGDLQESLRTSLAAVTIFDALGERENATQNRNGAAAMLYELGRPEEAWRARQRVFADISETGSPLALQAALSATARDEIADGRLTVARSFLDLLLDTGGPSPLLTFDGRLWRVYVGHRLGEQQHAAETLPILEAAASAIEDPALHAEAQDQLRFAEALLIGATDPDRARRLLDECIAFRAHAKRAGRLADAYFQRARVLRGSGKPELALADLREVMSLLEQQRQGVESNDFRDSFFAIADTACREAVEIFLEQGNQERAFVSADRCRGRSLLDLVSGMKSFPSPSVRSIQNILEPDSAVVAYAPLQSSLAIWIITPDRFTTITSAIGDAEIAALGSRLRTGIEHDDSTAIDTSSAALWRALIEPLHKTIPLPRSLIVVDDGMIAGIPLAALRENPKKPYLVEQTTLIVSPSASALIAAKTSRNSPHSARDALIVCDPALDPTRQLRRLPGAAAEAPKIGALYPSSIILTDRDAIVARVTAEAQRSDMIHIAAHAALSARDARNSAILLAQSDSDRGALTIRQIAALRLPRHPVVVLAGCQTGVLGGGRGSMRSLSYAFLIAGGRAVIATLWDVDDETSSATSLALHRRLRSGVSASAALRAMQLEMLASRDPITSKAAAWAAFQTYGFD